MAIRINECQAQNVGNIISSFSKDYLRSKYDNLVKFTRDNYSERVLKVLKLELNK